MDLYRACGRQLHYLDHFEPAHSSLEVEKSPNDSLGTHSPTLGATRRGASLCTFLGSRLKLFLLGGNSVFRGSSRGHEPIHGETVSVRWSSTFHLSLLHFIHWISEHRGRTF